MTESREVRTVRADLRVASAEKKFQEKNGQTRARDLVEESGKGQAEGETGEETKSVGVDVADQLYTAGQAIESVYDAFAKSAGLTPTEFYVYWALEDLGATATQKKISDYMGIPKQTVAAVIAKARAESLVVSRRNPRDARSSYLALTSRGHAMFDPLNEARKAAEMRAYETVGDENIRRMIRALKLYRLGLQEGFGLGDWPGQDE
ncbi:MarR family winged helix-turn-helix transcriptional regulator [Actinobaculum sp. 352]|uniref:MarR family winged helix-turn-helix transcriptional regulator n=1 Tax=Actinobaculum sp. 352 TaxID=2490946 RepID=UPI000F7D8BE2|nr:MarR family winged helix-turn-helix transcriptional regulator [Actinobaculum sp. 352]RTE50222.1 MarR family transcriptional regulator [Actinobaculum sp. 352]